MRDDAVRYVPGWSGKARFSNSSNLDTYPVTSNNIVSSSLGSSGLDEETAKSLLNSPTTYLASLPEAEAARIRSVFIPAYRKGFRVVFIIGAALAALACLVALTTMPQVELARPDDARLKEEGRISHKRRAQAGGGADLDRQA